MKSFSFFITFYVYLVITYLWYRFILRFVSDIKSKKEYPPYNAKVSVIIPIYNEQPYLLELCVDSLMKAKGEKELILADDCSTNNTLSIIKKLKKKYPELIAIHLKKNQGKRHAQYYALKYATGDIIVTVDSDTVIEENTILELIKPFNDPNVGATTGNARLFNREKNLLTKMVDARYKNAFTFERQGLSAFGIVTCCCGAISAYRKEVFNNLKDVYINQKFLGKNCTYGDDRHLTNLFIKKGYKIAYVNNAIAYTDSPTSYKQYIIQQLRWKKSFIRESLLILPYSLKNNKLLAGEILMTMTIPLLSLVSRVLIIYLAIVSPLILIPLVFSIAFMAFIRNMLLFFEDPKVAVYSIPFALFYELVLYWLYWVALFTLFDTGWGNRVDKKCTPNQNPMVCKTA